MTSTILPGLGRGAQQSEAVPAEPFARSSRTQLHPAHNAGAQQRLQQLPSPLIRILDIFFRQNETGKFFSGACAFNDVQFSIQRPIIGVGHHFVVYASPFAKLDEIPEQAQKSGAEVYCIKTPNFTSKTANDDFQREYYHTILQELRVMTHPDLVSQDNIIGLLGLDFMEDYDDFKISWPLLLMEYADFGTLDVFQQDLNGLQPDLARRLLLDVANGLQSLHRCNVIHGDVKSENVLICGHPRRQYVAKVSDFGLAVVNPSLDKQHYLPGCTRLWSAPEAQTQLSVLGMQLTDVYSFGLTVWRVLLNCTNPFERLPRSTTPIYGQNDFVGEMKSNAMFPQIVIQSIEGLNHKALPIGFASAVIAATLSVDPSQRSLEAAIHALSQMTAATDLNVEVGNSIQLSDLSHWRLSEDSEAILGKLIEAFPWDFTPFQSRPSVIYSLLQELELAMLSNSTTSLLAANLYFDIMTSPHIQLGDKSVENCYRLLLRLCELGSEPHRSIVHQYCKINRLEFRGHYDLTWLEDAASRGSYFAFQTLSTDFPQRFSNWKTMIEANASNLSTRSPEDCQRMLLAYCRTANFDQCHILLNEGTSAFPDWDEPGALHFLAMSSDPRVPELASRLIDAGAVLDHWEGNQSDDILLYGKLSGTPLHWAVWYRNIPLLRVLTERDSSPDEENVKRAILIAALMYFYDALDILRSWASSRHPQLLSSEFLSSVLATATVNPPYHLPRLLRHADRVDIAMTQTFEVLFQMHTPKLADLMDVTGLVNVAACQNHVHLFRYFVVRFELAKPKRIPQKRIEGIYSSSLMCGFIEIFDILHEYHFFPLDHLFGVDQFTGLQTCLAVRQRNPMFIHRYLEWGCPVDEMGATTNAEWTPFAMAVQIGLYDVANLLLQHGANKDVTTGWLGGTSVAFRMLNQWPDVPISRVKYLLEELPRQGFGHVDFIGWPAAGGNLLYPFTMAVWSHYRSSYKFEATMKYILSMMADKRCLNEIDRMGCTALNMAARTGNLEVVRTLIEAGADVNGGLGVAPLDAAMDWCEKWRKKERVSAKSQVIGERRHATKIRMRAEELIHLLRANGARERSFLENNRMMLATISNGGFRLPSAEMLFEVMSAGIDSRSSVNSGSIKLHPTKKDDFIAHRGNETSAQKVMKTFGRYIDQTFGGLGSVGPGGFQRASRTQPANSIVARYQPHSCYPWLPCPFAGGHAPQGCISGYNPPLDEQRVRLWNSSASTLIPPPSPSTLLEQSLAQQRGQMPSPQSPQGPCHPNNMLPGMPGVQMFSSVMPDPLESSNHYDQSRGTSRLRSSNPPAPIQQPSPQLPPHPQRTSEAVIKHLKAAVVALHNPSDNSDLYENDTQAFLGPKAVELLRREFSEPIQLLYKACSLEECIDFAIIESTITEVFGADLMKGVELMPELAADGRELWIHIFYEESKGGEGKGKIIDV